MEKYNNGTIFRIWNALCYRRHLPNLRTCCAVIWCFTSNIDNITSRFCIKHDSSRSYVVGVLSDGVVKNTWALSGKLMFFIGVKDDLRNMMIKNNFSSLVSGSEQSNVHYRVSIVEIALMLSGRTYSWRSQCWWYNSVFYHNAELTIIFSPTAWMVVELWL